MLKKILIIQTCLIRGYSNRKYFTGDGRSLLIHLPSPVKYVTEDGRCINKYVHSRIDTRW